MRQSVSVALMALASLTAAPTHAAGRSPKQFEPSSVWRLDYAEERCSLMRSFGTDEHVVNLQIDSYGSYRDVRFLISGDAVPTARRPTGEIRYGFSADASERERGIAIQGATADRKAAVSFTGSFAPYEPQPDMRRLSLEERSERAAEPGRPAPEFEKLVQGVIVEFDNRTQIELLLGSMEKPMQALRSCVDDLNKHWGLDPEQERSMERYPVPDAASVRKVQRSYPLSMVFGGKSAFVPVRIMVDAEGLATQCVVQVSNVEEAFREAVCDNLAHRFRPASNAAGDPVASVFRTSVVYMISR